MKAKQNFRHDVEEALNKVLDSYVLIGTPTQAPDQPQMFARQLTPVDIIIHCLSACLRTMENVVQNAPEKDKQGFTEELYDFFNVQASNVLKVFAPDLELRPDLTAEAILNAENAILDAQDPNIEVAPIDKSKIKLRPRP